MLNFQTVGNPLITPIVHANFDTVDSQEHGHSDRKRKSGANTEYETIKREDAMRRASICEL